MIKSFIALFLVCLPVVAGAAPRDPRVGALGMANSNRFAPAPTQDRAANIMSKNQLTTADVSISTTQERSPSIQDVSNIPPLKPAAEETKKDSREAERAACLNNNIGVGNTFVWASRYSNTGSYATMQEDVENPENNVCFAKVDIKSTDARINLSDMKSRYFQWGEVVNCGSWLDENMLEQRILDAKKKNRTWATVGGAVGGAALGVGSMELFGNKLIGGKVEGQKALQDTELLRSQLLVLKKNNDSRLTTIMNDLRSLKEKCEQIKNPSEKPEECNKYNYDMLLNI
ncbi:MAG: hypothetical protein J5613_01140 [Alphaproteobacteria bacterium]|nr:hypothetical protein [Alphaproteobacteria bacterium]